MAVLSQENVLNAGSFGLAATGTMLARDKYDETGDTSWTRPSVLLGIGTGLGALGLSVADDMDRLDIGEMWQKPLVTYGYTATTAGLFSAVSAKQSDEDIIPLSQRR